MRAATRIIALLPLLGAAGCMVGPDYEAPDQTDLVPESWLDTDDHSAAVVIAAWWTLLEDAELSDAIERALDSNLTLAEARERVIAARARRGIENADRLPRLDGSASYGRAETGDEGINFAGPPPGQDIDLYALGVVAGWEADLWGRVGRLVEAADAEIEVASEDLAASQVALAAEVAREVIRIRTLDRDTALIRATVQNNRDALDIANARAEAGFGDELDVARAQRDLDSNLSLLPPNLADRREAEFRLAVLLGGTPGSVTVASASLPRRDIVPQKGVPADLLLRRPDLRRAERSLAAATARIGAAKALWYPRVSLSGSITLQGPDPEDAINPDAFSLLAGPTITIPLFEGGRIRSQVQQAESGQRQVLIQLQALTLSALAEVETASMQRVRAEERAARLADAERAALDAEELALDRFTAGQADFLAVTEARQSRLALERTRTLAEQDALFRLVDLYSALGGGWDAPDAVSLAELPATSDARAPVGTRKTVTSKFDREAKAGR